ncbi:MAG: sulfatase [Myxococcales bacterium]|nr:sulfatase [Myxococcales bacterium]
MPIRTRSIFALLMGLVLFSGSACQDAPGLGEANLVVVVADALRADHLGLYGYSDSPPTSPSIDSWARSGVWFEDLAATSSQTVPSTLSLFTALYPRDHGNQYFPRTNSFRAPRRDSRPRVEAGQPLLAEVLRNAGFRTAAIVTNPWLRAEYGFDRGFDEFRALRPPSGSAYVRGDRVNHLVGEFLEEHAQERFFLYVHYMDVHSPYTPPPEHRAAFLGERRGRLLRRNGPLPNALAADVDYSRRLYAAEVRGFDDRFRELLALLENADVAESTLLVLLADHGEEFHEHSGMGHGWTLFDEVVRVPWAMAHPDLPPRPVRTPASGVDVAPTLLELLEVEGQLGATGRSLAGAVWGAQETPDQPRFSELAELKALRLGDRKIIAGLDDATVRAYDLAGDPGEQRPASEAPDWASELEMQLSRWLGAGGAVTAAEEPESAADEELERQLRELGYIAEPDEEPAPGDRAP